MKHFLSGLLALGLITSTAAFAEEKIPAGASSTVAFDKPTRDLMKGASIANGKKLAESKECAECHGDNGIGTDEEIPHLAGLRNSYLLKQMFDYRSGHRKMSDMNDAVEELKNKEIADLAAFYASLPPLKKNEKTTPENILKLVYRGDPKRMVKACASCHGTFGQGGQYDHPRISGQDPSYFILTMEELKNGKRNNDIWSRMRLIAKGLTDAEIKGLAAFYAGVKKGK